MKKSLFIAVAAIAVLSGCAKDDAIIKNQPLSGDGMVFTATIEQNPATRTVLDNMNVNWESGDQISINGTTYSATPDAGNATSATFSKVSGEDPTSTFYAYYPASIYNSGTTTLPATQTYAAGKISNNPMYAKSENTNLSFHNICGLVELTLKGDATIKKIIVTANEGGLSGEFNVFDNKAVLTDDAKTANKGVTLDCGAGVTLNNDPGVKFWIAIPEGTYTLTFSAYDANDTEGKIYQQITKAGVTVTANNIYAFEKTPTFTGGYFCFTALESGGVTVTLNKYGDPTTNALEYSTNLSSWSTIDLPDGSNTNVDIATLANVNDKVYIRAKEARTAAQDDNNFIFFTTTGQRNVEVSGNIMYLVDPTGSSTTISREYEFLRLFRDMSSNGDNYIQKADQLILPATTLARGCYQEMFSYRNELTTPPALPAMTLAQECYWEMFSNCSSLATAPALPATTLAESCYESMFEGCEDLTVAPILPAMTLAEGCYQSMFYSCEDLTVAPILPAATLVIDCYNSMFRNCSNLSSITCLATDIKALSCTDEWVNYIPNTGTFTKAPGMTGWSQGNNGIPSGWTVVDYYVDLGLSVKWAPFNVGATSPEKYGDYFAWGETQPYYEAGYSQNPDGHWISYFGYDWSSYFDGDGSTFTKYYNGGEGKTQLEAANDAAAANWGVSWRMPTLDEFTELKDNCTWTWTTNYNSTGVKGYIVTSNKTGYTDKSIFLPAAGNFNDSLLRIDSAGNYWSSSLDVSDSAKAAYFTFDSSNHSTWSWYRYIGYPVRPVCE